MFQYLDGTNSRTSLLVSSQTPQLYWALPLLVSELRTSDDHSELDLLYMARVSAVVGCNAQWASASPRAKSGAENKIRFCSVLIDLLHRNASSSRPKTSPAYF